MKKLITIIIALTATITGWSQVSWIFSAKKIAAPSKSPPTGETYEIHLTATVDEPWHIYSQSSPKGGPLPTAISFAKNPLVQLQNKVKENGEMEMYHDEIFDVDVYSYTGIVDFVQTVKLKANAKTTINGTVEFMACTREQCLTPQKIKFSVKLE